MKRMHWTEWLIVAVILVMAVALAYTWQQCDGTLVRTMFWYRCLP